MLLIRSKVFELAIILGTVFYHAKCVKILLTSKLTINTLILPTPSRYCTWSLIIVGSLVLFHQLPWPAGEYAIGIRVGRALRGCHASRSWNQHRIGWNTSSRHRFQKGSIVWSTTCTIDKNSANQEQCSTIKTVKSVVCAEMDIRRYRLNNGIMVRNYNSWIWYDICWWDDCSRSMFIFQI